MKTGFIVISYTERSEDHLQLSIPDSYTFLTEAEAREFYDSLDLASEFKKEWNARSKPWLTMKNIGYVKELFQYDEDDEYLYDSEALEYDTYSFSDMNRERNI